MRKTIILCDRCGNETRPFTVRSLEDYTTFVATDGIKKFSDVCVECAGKVLWMNYTRPKTEIQIWNEREEKKSVSTSNFEFSTRC